MTKKTETTEKTELLTLPEAAERFETYGYGTVGSLRYVARHRVKLGAESVFVQKGHWQPIRIDLAEMERWLAGPRGRANKI